MKQIMAILILAATCALGSCTSHDRELSGSKLQIGVMPKLVGIEYFNACERGALEAGTELGVTVKYDGPPTNDVAAQAQMVETWIHRGYDAIAIAPNDPDRIAPALRKARERGIAVLTYDADASRESRDFFVNQATYEDIARALVEIMVEGIGPEGKYVILTGSLTAANQNHWIEQIEKYTRDNYPRMANLRDTPLVSEEDQALAARVTVDALSAPGNSRHLRHDVGSAARAAEGLRQAQASERVMLTGLSTPRTMRPYVADGTVKKFVLWSPVDLAYLTVHAAKMLVEGRLETGFEGSISAGRLGAIQVHGDQILLGLPVVFDAKNIDQFDF